MSGLGRPSKGSSPSSFVRSTPCNARKSSNYVPDCLNRADYDQELQSEINPYPSEIVAPDGFEHGHDGEPHESILEHPCLALKKLLSGGTFYYSVNFDLTNRLQDR